MNVPFLELLPTYHELRDELDEAYRRVMNSGWYLLGQEVSEFEAEFASYVGTEFCVAVGNGLDAIRLALQAHGVGPGDEVIVPAHTFIATWLAVTQTGALPIGIDVCERTGNLDANLLESVMSPRVKAIIPVHLYGNPAEMGPIIDFARSNKLVVIEDAAQAHGAKYKGRRCGSLGDSAAFSFYPGKNLGAFSDGGAITTNNKEVADRARMLRNYGSEKRYQHETAGLNSRLDELQAAFLRVKLKRLDHWNERRQKFAEIYLQELNPKQARAFAGSIDGPSPIEGSPHNVVGRPFNMRLPELNECIESVWHLFVVRHPARDWLQQQLSGLGIQTIMHYPVPPHLSGAYRNLGLTEGSFPVAEEWARTCLSLPMGPHFPESSIRRVIEVLQNALDR